jgi:hypothetical protein
MDAGIGVLVVVYPIKTGEWIIAEINGTAVVQLGPFGSKAEVDGLLPDLYPGEPVVELAVQPTQLDISKVTILGNAAHQSRGKG